MTAPSIIRGLGEYMREVAKHLSSTTPMSFSDAHKIISYQDEGYAAAVLIRLRERGIAAELDNYTYVCGPRWLEAAQYYGWIEAANEARRQIEETEAILDKEQDK